MPEIPADHPAVEAALAVYWPLEHRTTAEPDDEDRVNMAAALTAALPDLLVWETEALNDGIAYNDEALEALSDAVDGLTQMIGYVPDHPRQELKLDGYLKRGRAALRDLGDDDD